MELDWPKFWAAFDKWFEREDENRYLDSDEQVWKVHSMLVRRGVPRDVASAVVERWTAWFYRRQEKFDIPDWWDEQIPYIQRTVKAELKKVGK